MKLFHPDNCKRSDAHKRIFASCELAYTAVDFAAALMFVVGSILFFKESTTYVATWLFLIGSIFFGLRPTIKLYRELAYLKLAKDG
ncbi:YrhK family protein [Roseobacter sp.]|uniref:YrhK family protein n=1 Tax=Roseobacter sp. TaxID=1907202 RepID=UPI003299544B